MTELGLLEEVNCNAIFNLFVRVGTQISETINQCGVKQICSTEQGAQDELKVQFKYEGNFNFAVKLCCILL